MQPDEKPARQDNDKRRDGQKLEDEGKIGQHQERPTADQEERGIRRDQA